MSDDDLIGKAVEREDVDVLGKALFDIDLYKGQEDIVRKIAFDKTNRLAVLTPSQYGKTWSIAAALGIYILLHEDKNVVIVSGTQQQAKIMRDKFAEFLADCPPLADLVDTNADGVQRLKKEASKKRITFRNGCELRTLTAGGTNDAESLMGHGADLVIMDESNLISDEIYEKRILRMLGNSRDSTLVQIGNPTTRNHFYDAVKNKDNYDVVHVDHEQAVAEGSFTQEYVDEMREEMTDRNFRVNIRAEFPEESAEDTLVKRTWIDRAAEQTVTGEPDRVVYGLDVARSGSDLSVLTRVEIHGDQYKVSDVWSWDYSDTMKIANNTHRVMTDRGEERVNVDTHGLGAGVLDRLREKGLVAVGIKVGKKANQSDRFLQLKAEYYWKLREIFEDGDIYLADGVPQELLTELDDMAFDYNTRDKITVEREGSKSPDYADSLMLALSYTRSGSDMDVGSARQMF